MAALGVGSAQAGRVAVTGDAHGQVLLFPYYTTQGNNETLLTITNITDKGKAVKVSFREAFNSREVLGFNLYLAPFDVWVGKVQNAPDGGAQLYTPDNSCSTLDTNPQTCSTMTTAAAAATVVRKAQRASGKASSLRSRWVRLIRSHCFTRR